MTTRTCAYRNSRGQLLCTECNFEIHLCRCPEPDELASARLMSVEGRVVAEVLRSLQNDVIADVRRHASARLLIAHVEIIGRLIAHDRAEGVTADEIHRSCVALAARALMLSIHGDSDFAYEPDSVHDREDIPR